MASDESMRKRFLSVYLLNLSLTNDVQRVILLCSIVQIRALQAQVMMLNQQRRRHCGCRLPQFWAFPRPDQSWFEIHYFDVSIPGDYFRKQLCLNRDTFTALLNLIRLWLTRQNTYLRDCVTPEKFLHWDCTAWPMETLMLQ